MLSTGPRNIIGCLLGGAMYLSRRSYVHSTSVFNCAKTLINSRSQFKLTENVLSNIKKKVQGKELYLLGNGPTLNLYNPEINSNYICCNGFHRIANYTNIYKPLLHVISDYRAVTNYLPELVNSEWPILLPLQTKYMSQLKNICYHADNYYIKQYLIYSKKCLVGRFVEDIHVPECEVIFSTNPILALPSYHTVAYALLQIAAYLKPKKVILAGIDLDYSTNSANPSYRKKGDAIGPTDTKGMHKLMLLGVKTMYNYGIQVTHINADSNWLNR